MGQITIYADFGLGMSLAWPMRSRILSGADFIAYD
jgi:hypothetical protein